VTSLSACRGLSPKTIGGRPSRCDWLPSPPLLLLPSDKPARDTYQQESPEHVHLKDARPSGPLMTMIPCSTYTGRLYGVSFLPSAFGYPRYRERRTLRLSGNSSSDGHGWAADGSDMCDWSTDCRILKDRFVLAVTSWIECVMWNVMRAASARYKDKYRRGFPMFQSPRLKANTITLIK
jgi:hypothetical protein